MQILDRSAISTQPSHHLEEEVKEDKEEEDKNKEKEKEGYESSLTPPSTTDRNKQQQIFSKPKIFIPLIAVVIGAVIVVAFVVFGSGIMHQPPQTPPTTVINPPKPMPGSHPPPVAIGKSFTISVNKPVNITLQGHSDQAMKVQSLEVIKIIGTFESD